MNDHLQKMLGAARLNDVEDQQEIWSTIKNNIGEFHKILVKQGLHLQKSRVMQLLKLMGLSPSEDSWELGFNITLADMNSAIVSLDGEYIEKSERKAHMKQIEKSESEEVEEATED